MNKYQEAFEAINCDGSTFIERTRNFKEKYQESPVSLIKELVDKETPTKVTHQATIHSCCTCPNCLNVIDEFEDFRGQKVRVTFDYCRFCGQKLDWSEE